MMSIPDLILVLACYIVLSCLCFNFGRYSRKTGDLKIGAWLILTCWLSPLWFVALILCTLGWFGVEVYKSIRKLFKEELRGILKDAFGRNK